MKHFLGLRCLCIFIGIGTSYGQYEFDLGAIVPNGQFAYLVKPAPTFEIGYNIGEIDSYYRFGMTIGYFSLSPTQDTFRIYGTLSTNSGTTILPGYEVVHHYGELYIGLKNEFVPFPHKKASPVIGLDLYCGIQSISEDDYVETQEQSSNSGDEEFLFSIVPRLGAQYKLTDKLLLTADVATSIGFYGSVDESYWRIYAGVKYFIQ